MVRTLALVITMLISPGGAAAANVAAARPGVAATQAAPVSIIWSDVPPMPVAIAGHVAAATDNGVVAIGGTSWHREQKRWHAQQWGFNVAANTWREMAPLDGDIGYAMLATRGNERFLVGGANETRGLRQVLVLPRERTLPPLPQPRSLAFGGGIGRWLLVGGGAEHPGTLNHLTDSVLRLDLDSAEPKWEEAAPVPGGPLCLAASAVCAGQLYVFGGLTAVAPVTDAAAAYRYQADLNRWRPIAPLPGRRRAATAVAIDDRFILVIGGCVTEGDRHTMLDEVYAYDTVEDRYAAVERLPYAAAGVAAVMHEGRLFVFGGEDRQRSRTARAVKGELRWPAARP